MIGSKPSSTARIYTDLEEALTTNEINIYWEGEEYVAPEEGEPYLDPETLAYEENEFKKGYIYSLEIDLNILNKINESYMLNLLYTNLYLNGKKIDANNIADESTFLLLDYTYDFLNNTDNLTYTIDSNEKLYFRIDADINDFEYITIGDIKLDSEDYILTKGSTIITLTDKGIDKIGKFEKGIYDVKVKFKNREEFSFGKLTLN